MSREVDEIREQLLAEQQQVAQLQAMQGKQVADGATLQGANARLEVEVGALRGSLQKEQEKVRELQREIVEARQEADRVRDVADGRQREAMAATESSAAMKATLDALAQQAAQVVAAVTEASAVATRGSDQTASGLAGSGAAFGKGGHGSAAAESGM